MGRYHSSWTAGSEPSTKPGLPARAGEGQTQRKRSAVPFILQRNDFLAKGLRATREQRLQRLQRRLLEEGLGSDPPLLAGPRLFVVETTRQLGAIVALSSRGASWADGSRWEDPEGKSRGSKTDTTCLTCAAVLSLGCPRTCLAWGVGCMEVRPPQPHGHTASSLSIFRVSSLAPIMVSGTPLPGLFEAPQ